MAQKVGSGEKTVILSGGGTAGHVYPCLTLVAPLREAGFNVLFIGRAEGVEKGLAESAGLAYMGVASGKWRRYKSFKNVTDVFSVLRGVIQALFIIRREAPAAVFAKGGFAAFPVCAAAGLLGVPVIVHESDLTPGLANRLAAPFCKAVCVSRPETLKYVKKNKGVLTGNPIRAELLTGSREIGFKICGFSGEKPVVMIMGGSSGAKKINDAAEAALDALLKEFSVIHLRGAQNAEDKRRFSDGCARFGYVTDELKHLYAAADFFVTRAGANSLDEVFALKKPALVIPLPNKTGRGDQAQNAAYYEKKGFCAVIENDGLTGETLYAGIKALSANAAAYAKNIENGQAPACGAAERIMSVIVKYAR